MSQTKYVAGAMFNAELTHVALIRKNRPDWQAGRLNLIGGHVEPNEMFITTMVREFWEETGVKTKRSQWRLFEIVEGETSYIKMYCTIGDPYQVRTTTDEEVGVYHVTDFTEHFTKHLQVPNLSWLITSALTNLRNR